MRIALFTEIFVPKIDGITNRLRHTIVELTRQGHEVLVFGPSSAVAEYAGVRVVRVPGTAFPPYPGVQLAVPDPRILWELGRFDPHVVHVVGPACLGLWGTAAARALGLPIVSSYHTDFPRYAPQYGLGWAEPAIWPLIRLVHNAAHRNLTPSHFTREELLDHGVENVGLWRGGVDNELFHPRRRCLKTRLELASGSPEGPLLLYAGRISPEKNLTLLAEVLERIPEAALALVGDGPARGELEQVFRGRRVRFTGFLRGEALARAFASADCFVMPSRTETLGFVALEAMSSGVPVVAAEAGGLPDLVTHEENGMLFDPDRPEEAAACIRAVLSSPGRHRFHARNARKSAENASWEIETRKLVDEYRRAIVLARRPGLLGRVRNVLPG